MTTAPTREGLFTFVGKRHTQSRQWFVSERELVQVRKTKLGKGLVVAYMGRAATHPIDLFEGEWTPVRLKSLFDEHEKEKT